MADIEQIPAPIPDGLVPTEVVVRTEQRWLLAMVSMLGLMVAVVVVTGVTHAIHPPSNVQNIDPRTLHLSGEFVESNLGSAQEPDGSVTVRAIADQYAFVPACIEVPADTPIKIRLTSADVIHGFLLPYTNVNTMIVPGFISEVRTQFDKPGIYRMPCDEFCGPGHHGMWARVSVVPKNQFSALTPTGRATCAQ